MNGYNAGTGYDLATGWGSVDANAMVTNWPAVTATLMLTVSASYGQAIVGSPVTLTAVLAGLSVAGATGTVQFYDNGTALGASVYVSNGTAQFTTSALAPGAHSITASYSGDANFNSIIPCSSTAFNLQVVKQAML